MAHCSTTNRVCRDKAGKFSNAADSRRAKRSRRKRRGHRAKGRHAPGGGATRSGPSYARSR